MSLLSLCFIAFGLSMDAFAIAVCRGISASRLKTGQGILIGIWFGSFQGVMPILGYYLGAGFAPVVKQIDHWLAFFLLSVIGINMIRGALKEKASEIKKEESIHFFTLFILAVASSIDALAIGVTFAFLEVNILMAAGVIAAFACLLSIAGTYAGRYFGAKIKTKAELAGGMILIVIGTNTLVSHLFEHYFL